METRATTAAHDSNCDVVDVAGTMHDWLALLVRVACPLVADVDACAVALAEDVESTAYVARFRVDSACSTLFVHRYETSTAGYMPRLRVLDRPTLAPDLHSITVILKRPDAHDPTTKNKPLDTRIHSLTLAGFADGIDLYEAFRTHIHAGLFSLFDAYTSAHFADNSSLAVAPAAEPIAGIHGSAVPTTRKRFAELELSLFQLQHNVSVPEPNIIISPHISNVVDKCRAEGRPPTVDDLGPIASDPTFLNALQNNVATWLTEIQNVTGISRDSVGSTMQEIDFWTKYEVVLMSIDATLNNDYVRLTMDTLKVAKRFHTTISFMSDIGLREALDKTKKYNILIKDIPLQDLLVAMDLTSLKKALCNVVRHVVRKIRLSTYPIQRSLELMQAISADFNTQLEAILSTHRLFIMPHANFESLMTLCLETFNAWDDEIKDFVNSARDLIRKRGEKFIPIKINAVHARLKDRIKAIGQFRTQHNQLLSTVTKIVSSNVYTDYGAKSNTKGYQDYRYLADEVKKAYTVVETLDVLNVSHEGISLWNETMQKYNDRIVFVENMITNSIRDRVSTADGPKQVLRIITGFSPLFIRPRIRGAVQEYQLQLIDTVKDEISTVQKKAIAGYQSSNAHRWSDFCDIPQISGFIMWSKQLHFQLDSHIKRVEKILGNDWESYPEGQRILAESLSIKRKLDPKPVFDNWMTEMSSKDLTLSGNVFLHANEDDIRAIQVNFDSNAINIAREVQQLQALGFHIPYSFIVFAKECTAIQPLAMSLVESIKVYKYVVESLSSDEWSCKLLENNIGDVVELIKANLNFQWDALVKENNETNNESMSGVHNFAVLLWQYVDILRQRSLVVVESSQNISNCLMAIKETNFDFSKLSDEITKIQTVIRNLSSEGFYYVDDLRQYLDSKIFTILKQKLELHISLWAMWFNYGTSVRVKRPRDASIVNPEHIKFLESQFVEFSTIELEIKLMNQSLYVDPPLEVVRSKWSGSLKKWTCRLLNLPRLKDANKQIVSSFDNTAEELNYTDLVEASHSTFTQCYELMNSKYEALFCFVQKMLRYQFLWEVSLDGFMNKNGQDISRWENMISDLQEERPMIDGSESFTKFGCTVIYYKQVQAKVKSRYNTLLKSAVGFFATMLQSSAKSLYKSLSEARYKLEEFSSEKLPTLSATVQLLTELKTLKQRVTAWNERLVQFKAGERILKKAQYIFPADWLAGENLESQWESLQNAIEEKENSISVHSSDYQKLAIQEISSFERYVTLRKEDWQRIRPVDGSIDPQQAIAVLDAFDVTLKELNKKSVELTDACNTLELFSVSLPSVNHMIEESNDLRHVWDCVSSIHRNINDLRITKWNTLDISQLKTRAEALLKELEASSVDVRHYSAYEHALASLNGIINCIPVLKSLKFSAFTARHWEILLKKLDITNVNFSSSLSLGDILDMNLLENATTVESILTVAQGELALSEFLQSVRSVWSTYSLDLISYHGKLSLVRGWDDIFSKCNSHLVALASMKHSPYYRFFEEEALLWETRLNKVLTIFDHWCEVQRQWVYLDGIFSGDVNIRRLLPVETNRFRAITVDFVALSRKVVKTPLILEVLNIPNLSVSIERIVDQLEKTKRSLGEYLEKQRDTFPRFYFIGDEDLLELLGSGNDLSRVQMHLKKMFPGVDSLDFEQHQIDQGVPDNDTEMQNSQIVGVRSVEGETFHLSNPVLLDAETPIYDWLARLEAEISFTLADNLSFALEHIGEIFKHVIADGSAIQRFISAMPVQISILALQIVWTRQVEDALQKEKAAKAFLVELEAKYSSLLTSISAAVIKNSDFLVRKSLEEVLIELIHFRTVIRRLINSNVKSVNDPAWIFVMRFYQNSLDSNIERSVIVKIADASFIYNFEYLGIGERLVQTPLTEKCYLTLTQALMLKMGGCPYGPAGTGKTESVKALARQLGRVCVVFCCDESFDLKSMSRILLGLCRIGAWGCFDEFNRLEEGILSSISQQIQGIQTSLVKDSPAYLSGENVNVNPNTGLFVTMNPGYSGRSSLPDNLMKLFRSVSMAKPDKEIIVEVMLYSQGYTHGEQLSKMLTPLFLQCEDKMSKQDHYDFGLRALKTVVVNAGNLNRAENLSENDGIEKEKMLIVRSILDTIVPQLVHNDIPLMNSLLSETFGNIPGTFSDIVDLQNILLEACEKRNIIPSQEHLRKMLELYQLQKVHHGVMIVGRSGCGKSTVTNIVIETIGKMTDTPNAVFHIDPKSITKEELYGSLNAVTREWTDGLFTSILRGVADGSRDEKDKMHWIIFDGDVDPEWVENLNSVLDDNKLLTLPNGERIAVPTNVKIIFEVDSVKYATLATVSRCRMLCFDENTTLPQHVFAKFLKDLDSFPITKTEFASSEMEFNADFIHIQKSLATILAPYLADNGPIVTLLLSLDKYSHVMEMTVIRAVHTLLSSLSSDVISLLGHIESVNSTTNFDVLEAYFTRTLLKSMAWAFVGDCNQEDKAKFNSELLSIVPTVHRPPGGSSIFDCFVSVTDGSWQLWKDEVPSVAADIKDLIGGETIIPTEDTVKHEAFIYSILSVRKPIILCGPPGSGKTMSIFKALRKLSNMEVVGLNFSSSTTQDLILRTLHAYCECTRTVDGLKMRPKADDSWLALFCDEINLPSGDAYGTQTVLSFLRQIAERGGFWDTKQRLWVTLERVQIIAACNPPEDSGRVALPVRFTRFSSVIYVDYPTEPSLHQIYSTFSKALLNQHNAISSHSDNLAKAMIAIYSAAKSTLTTEIESHYVFSPRELTRWVKGIHAAILDFNRQISLTDLKQVWIHEGLRLFIDRLVSKDHISWLRALLYEVANSNFNDGKILDCSKDTIMLSRWVNGRYSLCNTPELRSFVEEKLKKFYETEVNLNLVVHDDFLEHILRIDRVLNQLQGHMLFIGPCGSGKTSMIKFVSWLNRIKVVSIQAHRNYTDENFVEDLRNVLLKTGAGGESICLVVKVSNLMATSRLELMNTLLANAEIPGLFEGDHLSSLISSCKERARLLGDILTTNESVLKWFRSQIMANLHIIFEMDPPRDGLGAAAKTSPALINRCVLNWYGDWSKETLQQCASAITNSLNFTSTSDNDNRDNMVVSMVDIHNAVLNLSKKLENDLKLSVEVTPKNFLDFIAVFSSLLTQQTQRLDYRNEHLKRGLGKLQETLVTVEALRSELAIKRAALESKTEEANNKLKIMVAKQQEAESKKMTSMSIKTALQQQKVAITQRRETAIAELAEVEPAVSTALNSVSSINKQQLTELRSMGNPPETVKVSLEAVLLLLGTKTNNWKEVQTMIRKDDFIQTVINFDSSTVSPDVCEVIRREYMSKDNFSFAVANRASKACGPLVQWAIAQVNYITILSRVEPLRIEIEELERTSAATLVEVEANDKLISELESSISMYKEEYANLVSESQLLKSQMVAVEVKVNRSVQLLDNLDAERVRWEEGLATFDEQKITIVGDALLCAAHISYSGYYDELTRKQLLATWSGILSKNRVLCKTGLSPVSYLNVDDKMQWAKSGLPSDTNSVENAVMIKNIKGSPLIIDPAGQALSFLKATYPNMLVVNFSDPSFVKYVENSIRLGTPILIKELEDYDPIIDAVLNKEIRHVSGRSLVSLGSQEVDLSPNFKLFLYTQNPFHKFDGNICSKVTFVNFTITPISLQNQLVDIVLQHERPDVDKMKSDLESSQGIFQARLQTLEEGLLDALNESKGSILEDDGVISKLENLQREVAEVTQKLLSAGTTLKEVEEVTRLYIPLAKSGSSLYFTLTSFKALEPFYQWSLQFYLDIFIYCVCKVGTSHSKMDHMSRLNLLIHMFFAEVSLCAGQSLRATHKTLLYIFASKVKLETLGASISELTWKALVSTLESSISTTSNVMDVEDSQTAILSDADISKLNKFFGATYGPKIAAYISITAGSSAGAQKQISKLIRNATVISEAIKVPEKITNPVELTGVFGSLYQDGMEDTMDVEASENTGDVQSFNAFRYAILFDRLVFVKFVRPDEFISATLSICARLLKDLRLSRAANVINLDSIIADAARVQSNTKCIVPIILGSTTNHDSSKLIDDSSRRKGAELISISMGSLDTIKSAENALEEGRTSGKWLLLSNVHFALDWLSTLEKRLTTDNGSDQRNVLTGLHANFRLFLTLKVDSRTPSNILRAGRLILMEPETSVTANLSRGIDMLQSKIPDFHPHPLEKSKVYLAAIWMHAIIIGRLRYVPQGWSNNYDFNELDLDVMLRSIDSWTTVAADGRPNISPSKIPWSSLQQLISQAVYGSRIESMSNDFERLFSLIMLFINEKIFESDFVLNGTTTTLSKTNDLIKLPDTLDINKFIGWVESLPPEHTSRWLGLPENAEMIRKTTESSKVFKDLNILHIA